MLIPKKPFLKFYQILQSRLPLPQEINNSYWSQALFYQSGSDALISSLTLMDILPGSSIGIPAYICSSVPQSLREHGFQPYFIDIGSDLLFNETELIELLADNHIEVMILVDYFGFLKDENILLATKLKSLGVTVIVDRCHSALSPKDPSNDLGSIDAIVYSFRKTFPVNSCGAIVTKKNFFYDQVHSKGNFKIAEMKYTLLNLLEKIVFIIGWPNIYSKFFKFHVATTHKSREFSSKLLPNKIKYVPLILQNIIFNQKVVLSILDRRVSNYRKVEQLLKNNNLNPFFSSLPKNIVPQTFPLIDPSSLLLEYLIENGVGAYSWPGSDIDETVLANAHLFTNTTHLNKSIVCIPIHQGLNELQLKTLISKLNEWTPTNQDDG